MSKGFDSEYSVLIGCIFALGAVWGVIISQLITSDNYIEPNSEIVFVRIAFAAELEGEVTDILCTRNATIFVSNGKTYVVAKGIPDPNYDGIGPSNAYYTECVYSVKKVK